ncbi:hypothetical protein G3I60_05000 [Streptomyces sp. SID13666]|uniref:hypothetical protein n=1 Tax=Streptomyces sp. SID13666 TaxID=2706054 RepID=UPI0013C02BCF|nr:hypothetical protein [Streptomyces sp. SID13666]NEA53527.1 hypothetical protein [Streptomyces sp. SID13666]
MTVTEQYAPTAEQQWESAVIGASHAAVAWLRESLPSLRMITPPQPGDVFVGVAQWDGPVTGNVTIYNASAFCFRIDNAPRALAERIVAAVVHDEDHGRFPGGDSTLAQVPADGQARNVWLDDHGADEFTITVTAPDCVEIVLGAVDIDHALIVCELLNPAPTG